MTASDVIRKANLRPATGEHAGTHQGLNVGDASLSIEQLDTGFEHELSKFVKYLDDSTFSYLNRRVQRGQGTNELKILSPTGIEELYAPDLGLVQRGTNVPVFRYIPPLIGDGLRERPEFEIFFVVMHSFGRAFDEGQTRQTGTRTVAIDPATGHNPARFANGVATFVDPSQARNNVAIHHLVSLRGDLVNSVSWDNRCTHGEGRGLGGINDFSIGIEHEEWMVRSKAGVGKYLRAIEDHGPYSEQQYAIDAFILKKLQAVMGRDFAKYIGGTEEELAANIKNRVPGCFSHNNSSKHYDPGAEFYLPPGFELGITPLASVKEIQTTPGWETKWPLRFKIWYSGVPKGTKISAYDRIFDKVARLRDFDPLTEVFDPSINTTRVGLKEPPVSGFYTTAASQKILRDRISGVNRAERMTNATRRQVFEQAAAHSTTVSTAWARNAGKLAYIVQNSTRVPVVKGGVAFDSTTGQWVTSDDQAQPSTTQLTEDLKAGQPAITRNTDPTDGNEI